MENMNYSSDLFRDPVAADWRELSPAMKKPSTFLRRLLWVGMTALVLLAAFCGLRLWLDASARQTLARLGVKPGEAFRPAHAGVSGGRGEMRKGTPVDELDLPGVTPETGDEAKKLATELRPFLPDFPEPGKLLNFGQLLKSKGIPFPENGTEAEAAAEYLRQLAKFDPLFEKLHAALDRRPWIYPEDILKHQSLGPRNYVSYCSRLLGAKAQAYWQLGRSEEAWTAWSDAARALAVVGESRGIMGSLVTTAFGSVLSCNTEAGFILGGWRDEDLARIPTVLGEVDALATYHRSIEDEKARNHLVNITLRENPGAIADDTFRAPAEDAPFRAHVNFYAGQIAMRTMSDTQIAANEALTQHFYDGMQSEIDLENRLYTPLSSEEWAANQRIAVFEDPLEQLYFISAAHSIPMVSKISASAAETQTRLDQARMAAVLEIERRRTGQFPEQLDAVAAALPGGLPHDPTTGQPYVYERTADGGYHIGRWEMHGNPSGVAESTENGRE